MTDQKIGMEPTVPMYQTALSGEEERYGEVS